MGIYILKSFLLVMLNNIYYTIHKLCVIFKSHIIKVYLNNVLNYRIIITCSNILATMNTLNIIIYINKD